MGKKTAKSKSCKMFHRRRPNADIMFNNFHVKFGNRTFIIEGLCPQFKDTFIFLYKNRKLSPHLYNQIHKGQPEQKIYITQLEAYSLIFNSLKTQSVFETELRKIDEFLYKINQKKQFIEGIPNSTIENKQLRQRIQQITQIANQKRAEIQADIKQCQRLNKISQKQDKIKEYLKKIILRKEKELFVKTIIMIIQCQPKICQNTKLSEIQCIVIFEQCFPQKYYDKNDLIQMIGIKNYDQKVANFYQNSQKYFNNKSYSNCNFIVCHLCMELISTEHKKQILECHNIIQSARIRPESYNDPNMFYQRIIHSNFNDLNQRPVQLGYNSYYRAQDRIVQFKCNRYLCIDCAFSKKQRAIDLSICDFCTGTCQCQKCRDYHLLVRFLAHYRNMGGDLYQIQKKFLFKYSDQQKRKQRIRYGKFNNFPHVKQMKNFYDNLTKIKNEIQSKSSQKKNLVKSKGNIAQKKSYQQISYFKRQNFIKNSQTNIKPNNKKIQQKIGQFSLSHPDTKNLKPKAIFLIPQRQKKRRQLMQKRRRKQLLNLQKDQILCSYLTNEELKQVIQKDRSTLIKMLQNDKILLKQIPFHTQQKESKKFALRPKTQAQKQKDQFYQQKRKIQNCVINIKMINKNNIIKDYRKLQSELIIQQKFGDNIVQRQKQMQRQNQQINALDLNGQFNQKYECERDFQNNIIHEQKSNELQKQKQKCISFSQSSNNEIKNIEQKQVIILSSFQKSKSKSSKSSSQSSQSSSQSQSQSQLSSQSKSSSSQCYIIQQQN